MLFLRDKRTAGTGTACSRGIKKFERFPGKKRTNAALSAMRDNMEFVIRSVDGKGRPSSKVFGLVTFVFVLLAGYILQRQWINGCSHYN
jgi:hypothetical protein